jgi:hypothetical protein
MSRRSGPTLYEAMSRSAAAGTSPRPSSVRRAAVDADRPAQPALLTPGSAIRVPVGYVWVVATVVIALVVGSYTVGRSRGIEAGRAEMDRTRIAQEQAADVAARLREPADEGAPPRSGRISATDSEPLREPGKTASTGPAIGPAAARDRPSDVLQERREPGKWYFQIITTRYDLAVQTAEAVSKAGADLGLDAQVVPGETKELAIVYLLPGFDKASSTSSELDRWREAIKEVGSRVVGTVSFGSSTEHPFSDAFAKKYTP